MVRKSTYTTILTWTFTKTLLCICKVLNHSKSNLSVPRFLCFSYFLLAYNYNKEGDLYGLAKLTVLRLYFLFQKWFAHFGYKHSFTGSLHKQWTIFLSLCCIKMFFSFLLFLLPYRTAYIFFKVYQSWSEDSTF